ncbi:hypothetical protein [Teichococcus aestuarii]|uniref:hypothetical protein n=1 Tax=Teichococcus aestuarii TaxID=568898 RepID=UPI003615AE39
MLRSAAVRKSLTFFLLKSANTALATLWSFLLAYSLVRSWGWRTTPSSPRSSPSPR